MSVAVRYKDFEIDRFVRPTMDTTPISEIPAVFSSLSFHSQDLYIPQIRATLRANFKKGITRPIEWRKHQILQLARMVQDNGDAFAESLAKDLGKPRMELYFSEIVRLLSSQVLQC